MVVTLQSHLPDALPARRGKVRDVYDLGDQLLIVATDRISAFDVVMANGIPDKGRALNQLSAFWFQKLASICPHHLISTESSAIASALEARLGAPVDVPAADLAGRACLAKKAAPLTIECVARGYISGSLLKEYRAQGPNVHELGLPEGLVEASQLPEPIFTPATKAESGHDENISWSQAVDRVGREVAELARDWTLRLYVAGAGFAAEKGLLLADTKFEFGLTDDGLIWIDEALTPDSSRYWNASGYAPGAAQPSYDKQFVRDYLESIQWDKRPPGPELPEAIVAQTRAKYLEAYRILTGCELAT